VNGCGRQPQVEIFVPTLETNDLPLFSTAQPFSVLDDLKVFAETLNIDVRHPHAVAQREIVRFRIPGASVCCQVAVSGTVYECGREEGLPAGAAFCNNTLDPLSLGDDASQQGVETHIDTRFMEHGVREQLVQFHVNR